MIRKSGEYKVEKVERLKNGKGYVTIVNYFEMEDFLGKGRLFGKTIIEPGNSIGYHVHVGDQEAYFILKGKALYNDNGKEIVLEPGDLAICRDGESHSIEAIGEENLEYIMLILYN
ncbi:Cupin domain-containing protein [[Clostridium] ultunense Esp]|uniref:Cupin domain-containing protein n=1 Tax=[Clostridium] ultunense Esp TaxID=1288971 RepID=M1YXE5_9FIRM|nr:cupin domain-containing protein [Schnuerera ultunensis]CCQ95210.1 Cupin domain-containing protein [[Clostridium] ultunense Esp]SHD75902.1 Cupin domain-containing protein [[Clostridium] ultunense Esp]